MSEFHLTREPIERGPIRDGGAGPASGSFVRFDGIVRNHHKGRAVTALDYEVYPELCVTEAELILSEATARFDVHGIDVVHRHGPIPIGGIAVRVEVYSAHRAEGFDACRWVIDQIKERLPIWKHETYQDGTGEWAYGAG